MTKTPKDDAEGQGTIPAGATGSVDYSLPEDSMPENQDDQSNSPLIRAAEFDQDDLPVSGDVSGGADREGNDGLAGAGIVYDDGIDPTIRTEMFDNAIAYADDTPPSNVNDEPGFDDGVPNSFSDFSVVSSDTPDGTTRLADPSLDAGGEVSGPKTGGSGAFDGGPARTTPLPGSQPSEQKK